MNKDNELFKIMFKEAYDTHREIGRMERENARLPIGQRPTSVDPHLKRKFFLLIGGILTFIGVEPVKVVFRKNLGEKGFNMTCLSLSAFLFFVLGTWGMAIFFDWQKASKAAFLSSEGRVSYLITGAFYLWLAVYCLVRAAYHKNRSKDFLKYSQGDAHLLAFMEREVTNPKNIQLWAEPLIIISIGILFSLFINILGGIPIIACGVSVWVYKITQVLFCPNVEQKLMERNEYKKERDNEDFYEIPQ